MHRQNAKLWTLITGAVVACPSLVCLYFGVGILIGQGQFTPDANTMDYQTINPLYGLPLLCLGLLPWLLPLAVWLIARRRPAPETGAPSGKSSAGYSPFSGDPYAEADTSMSDMETK